MSPPRRRMLTLFPVFNTGGAVSYIALNIIDGFNRLGVDASLWFSASAHASRRPFVRVGVPPPFVRPAYKVGGESWVRAFTEWRFLRSLRPGDVAYVWPGVRPDFCRRVKATGATLVLERINCHTGTAKRILDAESKAMGVPPDHGITDATVAGERADLELADFVFAPSPMVVESLQEFGVPESKILPASFGWEPGRIRSDGPRVPEPGRFRVLFVGEIGLRKGVHRLLDAWREAAIPGGELQLAGHVRPGFGERWLSDLGGGNVTLLGFVDDIGSAFRAADLFAFPSFEEGGPLVVYEAMAAGLPVVVSPMGAGAVATERDGGVILPPDDPSAWAAAFRRLAGDPELRAEMARRAVARAAEFTWDRCAAVRLDRLRSVGIDV